MLYEKPERANARLRALYHNTVSRPNEEATPPNGTLLFETFALQNHLVIGLFDSKRAEYLFHTSNLHDISEDLQRDSSCNKNIPYLNLIGNKAIVDIIITLEKQIITKLTPNERCLTQSFICGRLSSKPQNKNIRPFLQRMPVSFGLDSYPNICIDIMRNVKHLMTDKGIWFRVNAGNKSFSWFSEQAKLLNHDIVSLREKEVIKRWADGLSLPEIAEQLFISINTVKNHLKACRNRLHARDNTSLVELCILSGVLNSLAS